MAEADIAKVVSYEDFEKLRGQYDELSDELSTAYNELLKKVQSAEEKAEVYEKLQKRMERLEKVQAVFKGTDSDLVKAAPQQGYLRSVLGAVYGIDPRM